MQIEPAFDPGDAFGKILNPVGESVKFRPQVGEFVSHVGDLDPNLAKPVMHRQPHRTEAEDEGRHQNGGERHGGIERLREIHRTGGLRASFGDDNCKLNIIPFAPAFQLAPGLAGGPDDSRRAGYSGRMPRPAAMLAAALPLLLAAPGWAEKISAEARFGLWNDCRPIDVVVESAISGTAGIGLAERRIATALRAKLGDAGIYDAEGLAYLDIHVSVVGPAFHVGTEFRKWLKDPASGEAGPAATWISGSTGTHGGKSDYILASIAEHADGFIAQYLRVNADACER